MKANNRYLKWAWGLVFWGGISLLAQAHQTLIPIQYSQTPSGVDLYFVQVPSLPVLDVNVVFDAGSSKDADHAGLAQITASLLASGVCLSGKILSEDAIAQQLDQLGAQYATRVTRDYAVIHLRTPTQPESMKPSLSLVQKILNHPAFTEHQFQLKRNQQLKAIEYQNTKPDYVASTALLQHLYPHHPYANPTLGDKNSLMHSTRAQVVQFYQTYYRKPQVVVVGNVSFSEAKKIAASLVTLHPGRQIPAAHKPTIPDKPWIRHIDFPSTQVSILMGQMGVSHQHPDYVALCVGNDILGGGGLTSRLFAQVRERHGLAYGVNSQFYPLAEQGFFVLGLKTKANQADKALSVAKKTLASFIHDGPTKAEMTLAKQALKGQFLMHVSSNQALTDVVTEMAAYHLPTDYWDRWYQTLAALSAEDVHKAFQRHVRVDDLSVVTVGGAF